MSYVFQEKEFAWDRLSDNFSDFISLVSFQMYVTGNGGIFFFTILCVQIFVMPSQNETSGILKCSKQVLIDI